MNNPLYISQELIDYVNSAGVDTNNVTILSYINLKNGFVFAVHPDIYFVSIETLEKLLLNPTLNPSVN